VGGRLEIRSAPGTGTVIRGEVPVSIEPTPEPRREETRT
jgi:hypothetical protein